MKTTKQMSANFDPAAQLEINRLIACLFRAFSAKTKTASVEKLSEVGSEKP